MSPEKRTVEGWVHHLTGPGATLTLTELMALMLVHIRDNMIVSREAAEHTEGMLGAFDVFAAGLAERSGMPYPSEGADRARLAAARHDGWRPNEGVRP